MRESDNFKALKGILEYKMRMIDASREKQNGHSDFVTQMEDLWAFLRSQNSPSGEYHAVYEEFQNSDFYPAARSHLRRAQEEYETLIEIDDVNELLEYKTSKRLDFKAFNAAIKNRYDQDTFRSSEEEMTAVMEELGDQKPPRKLVMVGCGPLAQTLLYFSLTFSETRCIGIDNNPVAIEFARNLKQHFQLENTDYEVCNAVEYRFDDFDVIFVANFAAPKFRILQRIAETAPNAPLVVVRLPVLYSNLFYDSVEYKLIGNLRVLREMPVNPRMMNKTVLLKRPS